MKKSFFVLFLFLVFGVRAGYAVDLQITPNIAWQGKILTVKVVSPEGITSVKGRFLNQDFVCYRSGSDFRGIVGVPVGQKPGYYDLFLYLYGKGGQPASLHRRVKVWATRFPFSRFWLKPAKKKLLKPELVQRDWAQIEKVLLSEQPGQRWSGKFILPVKGKISQGFGHRQIINGRRAGSHRGVDFAVLNGTTVIAPNSGRVVFAQRMKVFGGTLVIDHGQGIHTLYFHLSRIYPKVGEEVKKGAVIGLSGDSGVSSGPHLHWGMSVHNLRVDPMQWVKYEI